MGRTARDKYPALSTKVKAMQMKVPGSGARHVGRGGDMGGERREPRGRKEKQWEEEARDAWTTP
eukprot:4673414-Pyramimonas_sp.AAC.1